jgi:hypothetical protein
LKTAFEQTFDGKTGFLGCEKGNDEYELRVSGHRRVIAELQKGHERE